MTPEFLYNRDAVLKAVCEFAVSPENRRNDGSVNWDFVCADMHITHSPKDPKAFDAVLEDVIDEIVSWDA